MRDVITILAFAELLEIAIFIRWRVIKAIRAERLHHTKDNARFMARYRAEHRPRGRITEAPPTHATPLVIRRRPADAGNASASPASAGGPQWSRSP